MRSLLLSLFLLLSLLSYSQYYERVGKSRESILTEFKKYDNVKISNKPYFIYLTTKKTNIIYYINDDLDICINTTIVPLDNKTSLKYLDVYKKKFRVIDYNRYEYTKRNKDTIQLMTFFNVYHKLSFSFRRNHSY